MNTYSFGIHHGVMFSKCTLRSKASPVVSGTIYNGIGWGLGKAYFNFNDFLTKVVFCWVIASLNLALFKSPLVWIDCVAFSIFTKRPIYNLKEENYFCLR